MRKYEVTLPDGRVVSRQYAYELKLRKENPEKYKALRKAKYERNKAKYQEMTRKWLAKFEEEHGMTYYEWRKANAPTK